MHSYYLAVDGGATKTCALLMEVGSNKLFAHVGGPTNHEVLPGGFADLPAALDAVIKGVLEKAGCSKEDIAFAYFGMAGMDLPYQEEKIKKIIAELDIDDFEVVNDAFLPVMAAGKNGKGIGVINGTGFSVAGIDDYGEYGQLGGLGEMSDDFGGGGWYAGQVGAAIYRTLNKGARSTLLLDNLMTRWGVDMEDRYDVPDLISEKMLTDKAATVKDLCMVLHESADAGDIAARGILERSATEYAVCIGNMMKRYSYKKMGKVPVVLAGSQFVKGSKVLRWVLQSLLPEVCEIKVLEVPPVVGALYELLRWLDYELTVDFCDYVETALKRLV